MGGNKMFSFGVVFSIKPRFCRFAHAPQTPPPNSQRQRESGREKLSPANRPLLQRSKAHRQTAAGERKKKPPLAAVGVLFV